MRRQIGSITELGKDHYKVTVTAGINPKTGKQARRSKTIRGSRKEAEKALIALAVKAGKGDEYKSQITLADYWNEIYLPNVKSRLKGRTVAGYVDKYNSHISEYLGGLTLNQITPCVIDTWLSTIKGDRKKFDAYRTLRMILRRAVKDRVLDTDPTPQVDIPKYRKYEPSVLTSEEAAKYINLCAGTSFEPMVLVMLGAGLRCEEAMALKWGDISEDGDITVSKAKTYFHGQTYEDETKTVFSNRIVRLPKSVNARLNQLRCPDDVPVLHNEDGSAATYNSVYHSYSRWLERLPEGVTRVPMKDLRHTSLTLTLEGGADLLSVSRRAGHSSTHVTAAYYLRPHRSVDEAAADGLDGLLGGA